MPDFKDLTIMDRRRFLGCLLASGAAMGVLGKIGIDEHRIPQHYRFVSGLEMAELDVDVDEFYAFERDTGRRVFIYPGPHIDGIYAPDRMWGYFRSARLAWLSR